MTSRDKIKEIFNELIPLLETNSFEIPVKVIENININDDIKILVGYLSVTNPWKDYKELKIVRDKYI